jgi:quercetin dioxygenase-like cupin family protein
MTEEEYRNQLEQEGFSDIRVRTDAPETIYPPHTHPVTVAHIVLADQMRLTLAGKLHLLHAGDRLDVPAEALHEAEIGGEGATYMIGDRA